MTRYWMMLISRLPTSSTISPAMKTSAMMRRPYFSRRSVCWYCVTFWSRSTWKADSSGPPRLICDTIHRAENPSSRISRSAGRKSPLKDGVGQSPRTVTSVIPPTGLKDMDLDPFTRRFIAKGMFASFPFSQTIFNSLTNMASRLSVNRYGSPATVKPASPSMPRRSDISSSIRTRASRSVKSSGMTKSPASARSER